MTASTSKKELREFGIFLGFLIPIFIGFLIPKIFGHSFRSWTLFIGIPMILIGVFVPKILTIPYKFWARITNYLARVNSNLLLIMIFVLVMQPTAFFMKMIGYDPLKTRKINRINSYREKKIYDIFDFRKIF